MSTTTRRQGRSRPLVAAQVIVGFVALLYLVELVDTLDRNRLDGYGIRPREVDGLDGIVFAPLLHHGWAHLAANTVLPDGNQLEKWEALTIGPRLRDGGYVIVAGSDNDFSVAQGITGQPIDIYVDWHGNVVKCDLDSRSRCEINPPAADTVIDDPVPQKMTSWDETRAIAAFSAKSCDGVMESPASIITEAGTASIPNSVAA